ncbi:hypothetical protein ACJ2A9_15935 [Anaerobacillus sp. MEB173]|uniref:hypothetical protein n=1 Tax=Anaerobacillus sp. MEB173 TaxID=3383345 RepID=UPI003F938DD7
MKKKNEKGHIKKINERSAEANDQIQDEFYDDNKNENIVHLGFFVDSVNHHNRDDGIEDVLNKRK